MINVLACEEGDSSCHMACDYMLASFEMANPVFMWLLILNIKMQFGRLIIIQPMMKVKQVALRLLLLKIMWQMLQFKNRWERSMPLWEVFNLSIY